MKRFLWIVPVAALAAAAVWWFWGRAPQIETELLVSPKVGAFDVVVNATGELKSKQSIDIRAPETIRKARIWQIKIQRLAPEGTVVKQGDFVAELDKSELVTRIKESELNLTKAEAQFTQTKLDCTLTLSQAREDMVNQRYSLEEIRLKKEQSRYEAPAVIRQVELEHEKAERALAQAKINYQTKVKQSTAKMREVESEFNKQKMEYEEFVGMMDQFSIRAPAAGMIVYRRTWEGARISEGSQISTWDPTVATLPDFTQMESIAYINEIDIQKVKIGQTVALGLDADPKKKLIGSVSFIANIGEQRPNSDAKVYEVRITLNQQDTTLRPAMTTSNKIMTQSLAQAVSVPLEAVHTSGTTSFVFVREGAGVRRCTVELGPMNENAVVIRKGLTPDVRVFLSMPPDTANIR